MLLGAASCGGGEQGKGATELYFTAPPDESGTTAKLIADFNERNKGEYKVIFREGNADTGQRLDKLKTQFEAGGEDLDVILGDVIWTAELAASGWVSDLSDRFPESDRQEFLPGSVDATTFDGKPYAMPWFTDTGLLYYRKDLLKESGYEAPRRPGMSSRRWPARCAKNPGPGTDSFSRARGTKAECATVASTSGRTAATYSTPPNLPGSSSTAPRP